MENCQNHQLNHQPYHSSTKHNLSWIRNKKVVTPAPTHPPPTTTHQPPPTQTNSMSAISESLLSRFWPNFDVWCILGPSLTDVNCHVDIVQAIFVPMRTFIQNRNISAVVYVVAVVAVDDPRNLTFEVWLTRITQTSTSTTTWVEISFNPHYSYHPATHLTEKVFSAALCNIS